MLSYTFINSHSQVSDQVPECSLVTKNYFSNTQYRSRLGLTGSELFADATSTLVGFV